MKEAEKWLDKHMDWGGKCYLNIKKSIGLCFLIVNVKSVELHEKCIKKLRNQEKEPK